MYEHTLADLISLALESTDMGCMAHDYVEVSNDAQRAWACWADGDDEHIQCIIDVIYIDELFEAIDVYGVATDGGKGAFYGTFPLL